LSTTLTKVESDFEQMDGETHETPLQDPEKGTIT
jgi:hypothetical protein